MAGTSRGNPMESIHDYLWSHCQAGRFDLVESTAFTDVGCTLLYSETPPSLVTGKRTICVNISDMVSSVGSLLLVFFVVVAVGVVFFHQELDLCFVCVSIACLPL